MTRTRVIDLPTEDELRRAAEAERSDHTPSEQEQADWSDKRETALRLVKTIQTKQVTTNA